MIHTHTHTLDTGLMLRHTLFWTACRWARASKHAHEHHRSKRKLRTTYRRTCRHGGHQCCKYQFGVSFLKTFFCVPCCGASVYLASAARIVGMRRRRCSASVVHNPRCATRSRSHTLCWQCAGSMCVYMCMCRCVRVRSSGNRNYERK